MSLRPKYTLIDNYCDFIIERDEERCNRCQTCVKQCSYEVHSYDPKSKKIITDNTKCVGAQRLWGYLFVYQGIQKN